MYIYSGPLDRENASMIRAAGGRLALMALLLILQSSLFIFELLIFRDKFKRRAWYQEIRQWGGPLGIAVLGSILTAVIFSHPSVATARDTTQCSAEIDADIAGKGVRVAAFAQVATLGFVSVFGSFHPKATGAKELGAGLVLTSVSLAIALLVRLVPGSLSLVDAAIGSMVLDGQNMALSIQLCSKEILASRWQTGIAVVAQVFGLSTMIAISAAFTQGFLSTSDCRCLGLFWWGWVGSCHQPSKSFEQAVFWTYCSLRFSAILQTSFHSLWNTKRFDQAEKDIRDADNDQLKLGGILINSTHPHYTDLGSARYEEYPATVTFIYTFYAVLSLASLANAEVVLHNLDIKPSSSNDSVGQIIALVVAGSTVARAIWLFLFLFFHEKSKSYGLVWPFKTGTRDPSEEPMLVVASPFNHGADAISLGTILRDPHDLDSRYSKSIPVSPQDQREVRKPNVSERTETNRTVTVFWSAYTIREVTLMECEEQRILHFTPGPEYFKLCAAIPEIRKEFGKGTGNATVYLICRLEIAHNMSVSQERETKASSNDPAGPLLRLSAGLEMGHVRKRDGEANVDSGPGAILPAASASHSSWQVNNIDGTRIYTYSVVEVTLAKDGRVVE